MNALNGELVIEGITNYAGATSTIEQNIDLSDYLQDHYKKALKLESGSATAVFRKDPIEKVERRQSVFRYLIFILSVSRRE